MKIIRDQVLNQVPFVNSEIIVNFDGDWLVFWRPSVRQPDWKDGSHLNIQIIKSCLIVFMNGRNGNAGRLLCNSDLGTPNLDPVEIIVDLVNKWI